MHYSFLNDTFFYTLRFFFIVFSLPFSIEYIFGLRYHTLLWKFHCIRLSFFLKRFCWRLNKVDAPSGNRSYHIDFCCFDIFIDVIRFNLKQKAIGVCVQKLTLWAILFSSARCRKNHTSRSCCCQGLSSLCRPGC